MGRPVLTLPTDVEIEQARRDAAEVPAEEPARSETFTYADGSQRIGVPPFPELSPIEQANAENVERFAVAEPAPVFPDPGMLTADPTP